MPRNIHHEAASKLGVNHAGIGNQFTPSFRPCPKPGRLVDDRFYERVKARDGICIPGFFLQDGLCCLGLDAHHLVKRGAGGPDEITNGISACRIHHQMLEARQISVQQARAWLIHLYGYKYTGS